MRLKLSRKLKKITLYIVTPVIFFLAFTGTVHAQWVCGFDRPDAQLWGNCSGAVSTSCRTDSTQGTQSGWWDGGTINSAHYTVPVWMQVQCFVQWSSGPGSMQPVNINLVGPSTNAWLNNVSDGSSLKVLLTQPGTYTANCYTTNGCLASADSFAVFSKTIVNSGDKRCGEGCNSDSDCKRPANGGTAVCRGGKCENLDCPPGKTRYGANCDCSVDGQRCGQTCGASVGLCGDGLSICAFLTPSCSGNEYSTPPTRCVSKSVWNKSPNIIPTWTAGYQSCGGNTWFQHNGHNPTAQEVQTECDNQNINTTCYRCSAGMEDGNNCESITVFGTSCPSGYTTNSNCASAVGGNCPVCYSSQPGPATLITPANNASVSMGPNNTVAISYDVDSSGWGVGCPTNNNTVSVMFQPDCTGTFQDKGRITEFSNFNFSGLTVGKTYCWRVDKHNGTYTTQSAVNRFTVIDDTTTIQPGSGVAADTCGAGYSGQIGQAGVTNPIDFNLNFKKTAAGNTFQEVWLAFVPNSGPYSDNNDTDVDAFINGKVAGSQSIAVRIDLINNRLYTVNGSGVWDSGVTSGDITNASGTATVKGFGSTTSASVSGADLTSRFRIQFNNTFPLAQYNVYVAAVIRNTNGTLKTSYADAINNFVYKKMNASSSRTTWGVDVAKPSVNMSGPTFTDGATFSINWNASDASGLSSVDSYITTDTPGSQLQDNSLGTINLINAPPVPAPPTTSNGKINTGNLGSHTYHDNDQAKQASYSFLLYAKDPACNVTKGNVSASIQKPWLISYNGDISANGGITGYSIPNIPNFQVPFTSDNNAGFLSTYSALSGNIDLPVRKQSRFQEYSTKLQNTGALPPLDSGFSNWYDFILDNVQDNAVTPFVPQPTTLTADKTISSWLGLTSPTTGGGSGSGASASNPKIIGSLGLSQSNSVLTVNGTYAYIAGSSTSLSVVNISDKTKPTSYYLYGMGVGSYSMSSQGNYLYNVAPSTTKMQVVDTTFNPSPKTVSNTTVSSIGAASVQVVGNYAYVLDTYSQSLKIFNISNPANPAQVSQINVGCNPQVAVITGGYAYVGNNCTNSPGFEIINVSSPTSPVQVGVINNMTINQQHVAVNGNTAYVSDPFTRKIGIIDITNKNAPTVVNSITTSPGNGKLTAFGNYIAVINNTTQAVDIYDVKNSASPSLAGSVVPAAGVVSDVYFDTGYLYILTINKLLIVDVGNGAPSSGGGSTPVATGLKKHVKINGNLIVNSGTICDMQTLIFVSGTVTINPDLTTVGNSACVFISSGDITINDGGNPKTSLPISDSALASYDLIYSQLVTDTKLVTTKDQSPGSTKKWDGIYINGGVISKTDPILMRDINSNANYLQPASIFVYDPRYREVFKDDLSYNRYSLREIGAGN